MSKVVKGFRIFLEVLGAITFLSGLFIVVYTFIFDSTLFDNDMDEDFDDFDDIEYSDNMDDEIYFDDEDYE